MTKYEIMLVINGKLSKEAAKKVADELKDNIKTATNLVETEEGLKTLAYEINKTKQGYYFRYNFETNVPAIIDEFRRLALINNDVLRHLIINLEKEYGYRAITNPKKVKRSEKSLAIYTEKRKRIDAEIKARKLARETAMSAQNKEAKINE